MARLILATSERGEFGLDYNASNGRVSDVYCTDPLGVSGTVTLDNGQVITQALSGGQTMPVPGNKVQVTPNAVEGGFELAGVLILSFQFGA